MSTTATNPPLRLREDLTIDLMRAFKCCPVVAVQKPDDNLIVLGEMTGALARLIAQKHEIEHRLLNIAAFAMSWGGRAIIGNGTVFFSDVHDEVLCERNRQRRLYRERKITFDCASPIVDARRKFRVLLEELGEVAQELDRIERAPKVLIHHLHLSEELFQVAAVAVAWLESLEAA